MAAGSVSSVTVCFCIVSHLLFGSAQVRKKTCKQVKLYEAQACILGFTHTHNTHTLCMEQQQELPHISQCSACHECEIRGQSAGTAPLEQPGTYALPNSHQLNLPSCPRCWVRLLQLNSALVTLLKAKFVTCSDTCPQIVYQ